HFTFDCKHGSVQEVNHPCRRLGIHLGKVDDDCPVCKQLGSNLLHVRVHPWLVQGNLAGCLSSPVCLALTEGHHLIVSLVISWLGIFVVFILLFQVVVTK